MKYPCLVLDHDDTVVKSSPEIHYPAFVETMSTLRPGQSVPPYDEFMTYCSEPGYFRYCNEILHFTAAEHVVESECWHRWVDTHVPHLYEGFYELLHDYKSAGGTICVVTHSERNVVLRDYAARGLPTPTLVFGSELPDSCRKPNLWPLQEITRRLGFAPQQMVMVDDLMTGLGMAKQYGALAVAAGWSHTSDAVRRRVLAGCDVYLTAVPELRDVLGILKIII